MAFTPNNMFIVTYRKYFYAFSAILMAVCVLGMIFIGFNIGIDFTGGSLTQVSYASNPGGRPDKALVDQALVAAQFKDYLLQPVGTDSYAIQTQQLTDAQKTTLLSALSEGGKVAIKEDQSTSIGPSIGNELKQKAYIAIGVVILLIVLFVTFAFRKVSEPVASWKFGLATIIALAHDVLVPAGIFVFFSHFFGGYVDTLFVSALLAILGFSVHDTIVVFDRIREHLRINKEHNTKESFDVTVGKSLTETFGRSINTSLTIFIVLMVLYFLGPQTTQDFTFTLIVGIIAGTYSSIFIASPLLVTFEKWQQNKDSKKK